MVDSYRAGGPLKWKDSTTPLKDNFGHLQPPYTEKWATVRTANAHKVLVSSMEEFDEQVPDARPDDREQVQALFDSLSSDGHPLYLTIYPAD